MHGSSNEPGREAPRRRGHTRPDALFLAACVSLGACESSDPSGSDHNGGDVTGGGSGEAGATGGSSGGLPTTGGSAGADGGSAGADGGSTSAQGGSESGGGGGGSGGGTTVGSGGGSLVSEVPRTVVEFSPSSEIFRNPERGFYRATSIIDESTLSWIGDEYSLYSSYVRLDDYRDTDLPNEVLVDVESGLAKVRAEGAKLILRFAYNFGPYPDSEPDAALPQMLTHIEQLGPILRENSDVIATLQAGFIGAWGE